MSVREICELLKAKAKLFQFSNMRQYQNLLICEVGFEGAEHYVESLNFLNPWHPYDNRTDYLKGKLQSRRLKMAVAHNALKRRIAGGAA
ncbi:hypothetical protein [Vibrio cionasavignyae]|uniref:hypothetical protein n=1 Tax=Vibrio cionasavignyae TaxID=2910252 RepID=UPI003D12324C